MSRIMVVAALLSVWSCAVCDVPGDGCCDQSTCHHGLECSHDVCIQPGFRAADLRNDRCFANAQCVTGLCGPLDEKGEGVCVLPCDSASDCVAGWHCDPVADTRFKGCTCSPSAEVCDGQDNDCDGTVDGERAEAACGALFGLYGQCSAAGCRCPGTMCGGTCTDLQTDALNCGRCGATCLAVDGGSAACVGGHCGALEVIQPEAIATPTGIAASATDVYWSDLNHVCQTTIASKEIVYFEDARQIREVAVQGDRLYWSADEGTRGEDLVHGPVTTYGHAGMFAVTSTRIVWVDEMQALLTAPLSGGETTTLALRSSMSGLLAADEVNAYWIDIDDAASGGPASGALLAQPLAGGTARTLVVDPKPSAFARLATDGAFVYWTASESLAGGPSQVLKVPVGGGSPITLADSGQESILYSRVLVDEQFVYWATLTYSTSFRVGSLRRQRKAGGAVETLFTGRGFAVTDFALDATGIDYLSFGGGGPTGVYRVSPR